MWKNRKRRGLALALLIAVLAIGLVITVFAVESKKTVEITYKDIKVTLDGNPIGLKKENGKAVQPFIMKGTTYLPIRGVASALGLDVEWDGTTNTVVLTSPQSASPAPAQTPAPSVPSNGQYRIGDTWTVPGQWTVKVNSVTATSDRNEYYDVDHPNVGAVYVIDYTYTNLGFEEKYSDGLFLSFGNGTIVDCKGIVCGDYPGSITKHPQRTPIGATCNAQSIIYVENPGPFKVTMTKYDGQSNRQTAVFDLQP